MLVSGSETLPLKMTEESSKKVTVEEERSVTRPDKSTSRKHKLGVFGGRKLWMTVIALISNSAAYWLELQYLYTFISPEHVTAFSAITRDFHWTMTAILLAYLGVQGAVDWKHGTTTAVSQAASYVKEKIESRSDENKTENITMNENIKEYGIDAPELKPFGSAASGDEEKGEFDDFPR